MDKKQIVLTVAVGVSMFAAGFLVRAAWDLLLRNLCLLLNLFLYQLFRKGQKSFLCLAKPVFRHKVFHSSHSRSKCRRRENSSPAAAAISMFREL